MPKLISGKEAHPGKQGDRKLVATDADLKLIFELARAGKSIRIIASRLGVSYSVLDRWLGNETKVKGDPKVRAAWEAGQAEHEEGLVSVLARVIENDKHKMQVPSVMFMLKCKHKWSERQVMEVEHKETPKAPSAFTVEEIRPPREAGDE